MSETSSRWTSRKLLLVLLVLLLATWLRWMNLIDASDWKQLAVAAMAIYGAANVAQKATSKPEVIS
jgi:hypothetical protein